VCDGDDHGLGFDLVWEGSFPAVMEQPHVMRVGARAILDASRFAQVGTWSGQLRVDGDEIAVSPEVWVGTRDRSWGIRPVGDPEPAGRPGDDPTAGLWWLYVPLRFDDHAVLVIVQEQPDGFRTLNDATRVWPDGRAEKPGGQVEIATGPAPGCERATLHSAERGGSRLTTGAALGTSPRMWARATAATPTGARPVAGPWRVEARYSTSPTRPSWPGAVRRDRPRGPGPCDGGRGLGPVRARYPGPPRSVRALRLGWRPDMDIRRSSRRHRRHRR
jgi:hypothetical protein